MLIVVGIIGIIAELTIPVLVSNIQEKASVAGLSKFVSALNGAISLWKQDINCLDSSQSCLAAQGLADNDLNSFDQIAKFMKIADVQKGSKNNVDWLPAQTYDYYGNNQTGYYGAVSKMIWMNAYQLQDGTTFTIDSNTDGFEVTVDVNGKKNPNRIGKDTFMLSIGNMANKDVTYFPQQSNQPLINSTGLCGRGANCNAANTDPTVAPGACPTAYVVLYQKLPDFTALSKTVAGFLP